MGNGKLVQPRGQGLLRSTTDGINLCRSASAMIGENGVPICTLRYLLKLAEVRSARGNDLIFCLDHFSALFFQPSEGQISYFNFQNMEKRFGQMYCSVLITLNVSPLHCKRSINQSKFN